MKYSQNWFTFSLLITVLIGSCIQSKSDSNDTQSKVEVSLEQAQALAHKFIILDGHIDYPYKQKAKNYSGDISKAAAGFDFDFEKARAGGLDAPFMSIYIPSNTPPDIRKAVADSLIDMVDFLIEKYPAKFAKAASPADIEANFKAQKVSLPMGMENGSPIQTLQDVTYFHQRGIRYITLTHAKDNQISDSSYDTTYTHNGLSAFGEDVVKAMNHVGIMVDVSHISDSAFYDVMKITQAPVIASHSSCRHFILGFERNMSDDMIRVLAKNGGVIQINFGSTFVDSTSRYVSNAGKRYIAEWKAKNKPSPAEAEEFARNYYKAHPLFSDVTQVAKHIHHVVQLVGIDHVGFGSDFDGVGDSLPVGLKTAADIPNLIYELLKLGYTEDDIAKICYQNVFRVWREVEATAKRLQ